MALERMEKSKVPFMTLAGGPRNVRSMVFEVPTLLSKATSNRAVMTFVLRTE